jgi:hypothetical protein
MLSRIFSLFGSRSGSGKRAKSVQAQSRHSATAHLYEKPSSNAGKSGSRPAAQDEAGFNPYDSGKFDRSASWERISKTQR